ncbi:MAG: hypothetical protein ABI333_10580 [bacterium]
MIRLSLLFCVMGFVANPCGGGDRDPKGGEGEPCYGDGTCDEGLICQGDVCGLPPPTCGNGVREEGEDCDDADLGAATCATAAQLSDGALRCDAACAFDTTGCFECGNGTVEGPEQCDGADLAGADCVALGYAGGVLGCTASCGLDEGGCNRCGDGAVDPGEACDDGASNGAYGFCAGDCAGPGGRCGDGVVNGPEACDDGVNVGAPCRSDCGQDLSRCGDGVLDPGEGCDDGAANSNAVSGACRLDCRAARCGDAVIDPGEVCDGTRVAGQTCESLGVGFLGGHLGCLTDCSGLDPGGCIDPALCGNGVLDGNEQCDGSALSQSSCGAAPAPLRLTPEGIEHLGDVLATAIDPTPGDFPIPEASNMFGSPMMNSVSLTVCPGGCTATAAALPDPTVWFDGQKWVATIGVEIDLVLPMHIQVDVFGIGIYDTTCAQELIGWDQPVYVDIGVEPYVAGPDGELALRVVDLGGLELHPVIFSVAGCGLLGDFLNVWLDYVNQIFDWLDAILLVGLGEAIYDTWLLPHLESITPGLLPSCPGCLAPVGYKGGALGCQVDTCELDRSQCTEPVCGDGVVEGLERCDATALGGLQCQDVGAYTGGTLSCAPSCGFDTSGCLPPATCGNATVDGNEQCDGTDLAGASCVDTGWFSGGLLGCRDDCTLDTIGCLP